MAETERKEMAKKAQKDLRSVVATMLQETAPKTAAKFEEAGDGWAQLKPRDLRKLMKEVQAEKRAAPEWENPDVQPLRPGFSDAKKRVAEELAEAAKDEKPDTVTIGKDGEYSIDVRSLLEKNPIVVHKDGAYLIHLPSLFGKKE